MRGLIFIAASLLVAFAPISLGLADGTVLRMVSVDGTEQAINAQAWAALPRAACK